MWRGRQSGVGEGCCISRGASGMEPAGQTCLTDREQAVSPQLRRSWYVEGNPGRSLLSPTLLVPGLVLDTGKPVAGHSLPPDVLGVGFP